MFKQRESNSKKAVGINNFNNKLKNEKEQSLIN